MFCPGCGAEYNPGVTICGECGVALVEEAPDNEPHYQETVRVFETVDPNEIAIAESLLQGAEIPYVVQNALGQGILGPASRESRFAYIEVQPEFVEAASELLTDLNEGASAGDMDEYEEEEDGMDEDEFIEDDE